MKLGLLGYPVEHSLSPKIYKDLLGERLESYELFSYPLANNVPDISFFAKRLDGLNITSPYKTHFVPDVRMDSDLVRELGIINTISFKKNQFLATNTDLIAVDEILENFKKKSSTLKLLILGDGAMAKLTSLVANSKGINFEQFSRKKNRNFSCLDLRSFEETGVQTIIINTCSRDYVFQGELTGNEIFWDYNYSFIPHQNSLPSLVKAYIDGQEMLLLQAKAAVTFWAQVK